MPSTEARTQVSKLERLSDVEDEAKVALLARQDLGKDFEDEVIESFLVRVEDAIDARVEARVRESLQGAPMRRRFAAPSNGRIAVVLGFVTAFLIFGIPLADIAGGLMAAISVIACIALAGSPWYSQRGNRTLSYSPARIPPGLETRVGAAQLHPAVSG